MIPKIWKAVAQDELRPYMTCALLTKDYFVATDAHILVAHKTSQVFNVDVINQIPEEGVLVPTRILKEMSKSTFQRFEFIDKNKAVRLFHQVKRRNYLGEEWIYEAKLSNEPTSKYPAWQPVLWNKKKMKPIEKVSFNPQLLLNLSEAMGSGRSSQLLFKGDENSAIIVRTSNANYDEATGLIMPTMFTNEY